MTNIKDTLLNFQYQYSRLFNFGLNRKKFECVATKDKLFAINTSKNTFLTLFFTLLVCGLLFTGLIEAFINKAEITIDFIIVFFVIHIIVGLVALRHFLWLINGRQELTIENGSLILTKKGTFLTRPKTYSLDLVTNIRQGVDEDTMLLVDKIVDNIGLTRKILFSHIIGQVLFDCKGETIKVFSDLDSSERTQLITELTKQTEKPAANSQLPQC